MANLKSVQATNARHLPVPSAGNATDLIPVVGDYVSLAGLANGDIIEMVPLPPGYVLEDVILDIEDLDSNGAPTATVDVGIMSGSWGDSGARTCGAEFIAGSTVPQAGGIARLSVANGGKVAPTTTTRSIGLKISAAIATLVVGAKMRLTALLRPQVEGV
jgi:hypothetical protein